MKIKEGMTIIVHALEWREPDWEFDHPTVLLSPIRRYSPNGDSIAGMVEQLGIDAAVDGELKDHDEDREFEWRGWSWTRLERVWREAMRGKGFPVKQYQAAEYRMTFHRDDEGFLAFSTEPKI